MVSNRPPPRATDWRLVLESVDRGPVALCEGRHTIGASAACTLIVPLPWSQIGAQLWVTASAVRVVPVAPSVPVKVDGVALTAPHRIGAEARDTSIEIGPVRLRLLGAATVDPMPRGLGALVRDASHPQRWWFGATAAVFAVLLGVVLMFSFGATEATPSASAIRPPVVSAKDLAEATPAWTVASTTAGDGSALEGVLRTRADCARMDRIRAARGADRFVDRTVCLPTAIDHANELLAGSPLRAEPHGDAVRLTGEADRETAERWMRVLGASLPGLRIGSDVTLVMPNPPAGPPVVVSGDGTSGLVRTARELVAARQGAMTSPLGPGALVLEDGRVVRPGESLRPGIVLVRVDDDAVHLRVRQRAMRIATDPVTVARTERARPSMAARAGEAVEPVASRTGD